MHEEALKSSSESHKVYRVFLRRAPVDATGSSYIRTLSFSDTPRIPRKKTRCIHRIPVSRPPVNAFGGAQLPGQGSKRDIRSQLEYACAAIVVGGTVCEALSR